MINSSRKYEIVTCEHNVTQHSLSSIIELEINTIANPPKNSYEVIYALNDDLDKVLDLKINESLYFQPIRDNNLTKAIVRIS